MSELMRWDPARGFVSLREAMDRLFEDSVVRSRGALELPAGAGGVAVDMYETEEAIIVEATVPGVKLEDLEVSVADDAVTIRGETRREVDVKEDNYIRSERFFGSFCRSLPLPGKVIADDAEAVFEDGVLTLTLPKVAEPQSRAIKIKSK